MAIGIQATDVWAAADALLRAGEQPTVERVRGHLGRGSPNTVGPHLKAWFRTLGQRLAGEEGAREEGGDVPAAVSEAFDAVWRTAREAAVTAAQAAMETQQQAVASARDALAHDRERLQQETVRLAQRETDLTAAVGAARAQADAAEGRARALEARLRQADATLQTVQEQRGAAQAAERDAVQALQHEQVRHREALGTAQRAHESALEAAAQAHRVALTQAENRHASHERRWLSELDAERQAARRAVKTAEQERQTAATQLADIGKRLAIAQQLAAESQQELTTTRAAAQQWEARCAEVQSSAAAVQTALRERNTDLNGQVDDWKRQCRAAEARLDRVMNAAAGRARRAASATVDEPSSPPISPDDAPDSAT